MPATGSRAVPSPRPRRFTAGFVALLVATLLGLTPRAALASDEGTTQAKLLVLQSISLIANGRTPDVVAASIRDALNAPDKRGTDVPKVRQALSLVVKAGAASAGQSVNLDRAQALLNSAIDIRAATGYGTVPKPGQVGQDVAPYASGAATGTTVVLNELRPARGISDGGDVALLIIALLALVLGVYLSIRWRPNESIRELRRRSAAVESEELP